MVYLGRKDGKPVHHTSKKAMMELDGIEPEMEVTDKEFEVAGGLVRIIKDKIFLGKTKREKEKEALRAEKDGIDKQLLELDKIYLTPRILAGIGKGDDYANEQFEAHETAAIPLRERKQEIKEILGE
jgi:hypothetical protein